jgi:LDH2 family malate/lactate/ureidoglycolate dehydrogenase
VRAGALRGCISVAMCNTRPLMPAPGGAQAVVGNNPIAIALPSESGEPVVLDMAMSEASMGKIRIAQATKSQIPPNWATDNSGEPTTDPAAAIAGMLLPAAGPKGYGLAFMIDLISGALSGGAWGHQVKPLYGPPDEPYDCSHFFLAIDVAFFGERGAFEAAVDSAIDGIRQSRKAPGISRLFTPGERSNERAGNSTEVVEVPSAVAASLLAVAVDLQIGDSPLTRALH